MALAEHSLLKTPSEQALAEIGRLFHEQITPLRLHPGASLAVYAGGRLILDLQSGWADTQRAVLVDSETLFPLFSGTKPLVSVALLQQIERGKIALDDTVAQYWPEYGQKGKEQVTVHHLLTHRGGFPATPPELPPASWGDPNAVREAIAAMPLAYLPGSATAYHSLTQHWVCAELVRRLDGREIAEYLRDEIIGPLNIRDTYLGLPPELERRLVRLHATDGSNDRGITTLRDIQDFPVHRLAIPGASGVSTARDMARFYAALAGGGELDGVRILTDATVERMQQIEVEDGIDLTFDIPVRRGLGIELGGIREPRRHWPGATSTVRTMWHGGFGTSVCWGDSEIGISMAFMTNGVRADEAGAIARRDLSDAVRCASRS